MCTSLRASLYIDWILDCHVFTGTLTFTWPICPPPPPYRDPNMELLGDLNGSNMLVRHEAVMFRREMGQSPKMAFALFILSLIAVLHHVLSNAFLLLLSPTPSRCFLILWIEVFQSEFFLQVIVHSVYLPWSTYQLVGICSLHVGPLFALCSSVQTRLLLSHRIPLAARAHVK